MSTCRYCGRPVRWALTEGGKTLAVDTTPDPRGRIVLEHRDTDNALLAYHEANVPMPLTPDRYLAHRDTCPHIDQWPTARRVA